jgi:type II secretory pathway pseudopilin PulG
LVEILAAVTIMSIISVIFIGYFVSAMNKSTEQNKRIIGANLARQKAAEVREFYRTDQAGYPLLLAGFSTTVRTREFTETNDSQLVHTGFLSPMEINGTQYRFLVRVDNDNSRRSVLGTMASAPDLVDRYLLNMRVSVYWGDEASYEAQKTSIESYVVKGW